MAYYRTGGGVPSSKCTATAGDVLKGQTYLGKDTANKVGTGTLALSGNAAVGDVLKGVTFYNTNAKSKQTGTLALSGTAAAGDVLKGKTFYNTNAKSAVTGTLALSGTATAADVLKGKTFYNTNAKTKVTGTYEPSEISGDITKAISAPQQNPTATISCNVGDILIVIITSVTDQYHGMTITKTGCDVINETQYTVSNSNMNARTYVGVVKATSDSIVLTVTGNIWADISYVK